MWLRGRRKIRVGLMLSVVLLSIGILLNWLYWERPRSGCRDEVRLILQPPLGPARYELELSIAGKSHCVLRWDSSHPSEELPNPAKCPLLSTFSMWEGPTITELRLHGSPQSVHVKVTRNEELVIDTTADFRPERLYANCAPVGTAVPQCLRGSSWCEPFPAACDGPEDCSARELCCTDVSQGYRYQPDAAARCGSRGYCPESEWSGIACHRDGDCPNEMRCDIESPDTRFRPPLFICRPR